LGQQAKPSADYTAPLEVHREFFNGIHFAKDDPKFQMEAQHYCSPLKSGMATDYRSIVLDLRDVRLADRDAVKFLRDCEADGMKLENCPAYVREWMEREKD
jgi:hypothetical protein